MWLCLVPRETAGDRAPLPVVSQHMGKVPRLARRLCQRFKVRIMRQPANAHLAMRLASTLTAGQWRRWQRWSSAI
jgi:hypothetical protein